MRGRRRLLAPCFTKTRREERLCSSCTTPILHLQARHALHVQRQYGGSSGVQMISRPKSTAEIHLTDETSLFLPDLRTRMRTSNCVDAFRVPLVTSKTSRAKTQGQNTNDERHDYFRNGRFSASDFLSALPLSVVHVTSR